MCLPLPLLQVLQKQLLSEKKAREKEKDTFKKLYQKAAEVSRALAFGECEKRGGARGGPWPLARARKGEGPGESPWGEYLSSWEGGGTSGWASLESMRVLECIKTICSRHKRCSCVSQGGLHVRPSCCLSLPGVQAIKSTTEKLQEFEAWKREQHSLRDQVPTGPCRVPVPGRL